MTVTNGSPTWIDLGTTDMQKSKDFYQQLFGWNFTSTGPDFGDYNMIDLDGAFVGGLGPNMGADGRLDDTMPVWWTVYLRTDDIDQALERVAANGGTVFVDSMAVGDLGSMAIVGAPSGAAFGLWQANQFDGFDAAETPGHSIWFESMTKDFGADAPFYAAVLGWENAPMAEEDDASGTDEYPDVEDNGGRYVTNFPGDAATAGLCEANAWLPDEMPSFWRAYFKVADVDASIARIEELGGSVLDGPADTPFGRLATVADNLGGSFQIIQ